MTPLQEVIAKFEPISLDALNTVSLLNRVDTKFLLSSKLLPTLLNELVHHNYILEIDGIRKFSYETNYYDTPDYSFYRDHHNGCINRIKVRTRSYTDSGLHFYEIKNKLRGTRTNKVRKVMDVLPDFLTDTEYEMINYQRYEGQELIIQLKNAFNRITLTNKEFTERITIDTDISFMKEDVTKNLSYIAVIEVKQGKTGNYSHTMLTMKKYGIRPSGFSKYAMGIALLGKNIKKNNFKPTLLKLNKIANATRSVI